MSEKEFHRYMLMIVAIFALIVAMAFSDAFARRIQPEDTYNRAWCATQNGRAEVVQMDGTRVDCLTDAYAVEADFAGKWYEAVGQGIHYARLTGLLPGVLLIVERPADCRYIQRAVPTISSVGVWMPGRGLVPVRVWIVNGGLCDD